MRYPHLEHNVLIQRRYFKTLSTFSTVLGFDKQYLQDLSQSEHKPLAFTVDTILQSEQY
jgi:hypothetical protein